MALNEGSQPVICVLTGYDLKPSRMSSSMRIFTVLHALALVVHPDTRHQTRPREIHVTLPSFTWHASHGFCIRSLVTGTYTYTLTTQI